jgi:hypothetical protein
MKTEKKYLTKEECLQLDIKTYNKAMELQWKTDKVSGNLSNCEYCGRKYLISCICDKATERFNKVIEEIRYYSKNNDENI